MTNATNPFLAAQTQLSEIAASNVEAALRLAQISLDSFEKLTQLNLATTKQHIDAAVKNTQALTHVKDVQQAVAARNTISEATLENAISYSQGVYDIAAQAKNEMGQLVEERIAALNKAVIGGMDQAAKNAPAGTDVAVNAVKSTIEATTTAVDNLTKAAKQVAEFADASAKAAASTTIDALKSANKKVA